MRVYPLKNSCGLTCLFLHIYIVMSPRVCVNNIINLILIIYSMCDFNCNYIFYCMIHRVKTTKTAKSPFNNTQPQGIFSLDVRFIELQFFKCIYILYEPATCSVMCLENIINYCFKNGYAL